MNRSNLRTITLVSILSVLGLSLNVLAGGQSSNSMKSASKSNSAVTLTARLIDPEKKAKEKTATVEVTVTGVQLIDPATVKEQPRNGQGHLHYRVDDGPVIATTAPKLSFH